MSRSIIAAFCLTFPVLLAAQDGTEIYVSTVRGAAGSPRLGAPQRMTRRPGYDNQPGFTSDGGSLLYTSQVNGQTDIYMLPSVGARKPTRLTETPESEYSPTPMADGMNYSAVRVEADSTQRLWIFRVDGGKRPWVTLPTIKPVGYHVWINSTRLALFILGSPNTLQFADTRRAETDTVATNIGRALQRIPARDEISFVQLGGDTNWISAADTRSRSIRRIAPTPPGSDYHAWLPTGQLIASSGSQLLVWREGQWETLVDFKQNGIRGISRLAVSPRGDRIAFVASEAPPSAPPRRKGR
ncbi:MAG: hypothetical protein K2X99_13290 [Gemmatimonadaceae bacterium]|nr:hypothetical protein [Gemmatimonadaceae bacterium]